MIGEELSVYFENPARDAMGYEHVSGCLRFTRDEVTLHFDEKDRAFRKTPPETVHFRYREVTSVDYVKRWFRPHELVFKTSAPDKLSGFPGAAVGEVVLLVKSGSRREAAKVPALVTFKLSEAYLAESEERLQAGRDNPEASS